MFDGMGIGGGDEVVVFIYVGRTQRTLVLTIKGVT